MISAGVFDFLADSHLHFLVPVYEDSRTPILITEASEGSALEGAEPDQPII